MRASMRDTIELAREAGILAYGVVAVDLERFADLVRADAIADERDKWMERAAILIRGEREACAKVCDELANDENTDEYINGADWCAVRIRARGNT